MNYFVGLKVVFWVEPLSPFIILFIPISVPKGKIIEIQSSAILIIRSHSNPFIVGTGLL